MKESLRARVKLLGATSIAFVLGLWMASAMNITPVSFAAVGEGPNWVVGAPGIAAPSMENGFAEVADRVAPTVVTIYARGERCAPQFPFRAPPFSSGADCELQTQNWSGSGFIVSDEGYVVTNNHVVADASRIDIELADGRRLNDAQLLGRDPQTDVALARIEADNFAVLPIGSSEETNVGEWVLAIGSPGFNATGRTLHTSVTAGIVSAKGRNINILGNSGRNPLAIEDFIQTDAAINQGNSGGPLVNAAGEVIGINTAILSTTGSYQGYGFAVPIELVQEVVDDLIEFGEVRRALIGVGITDVNAADARFYELDEVGGAVIQSFSFDESPARLAGLDIGDVLVGVEGRMVAGVSELQRRIRAYEPGETVTLDVVRRATREREAVEIELIPATPDPTSTTSLGPRPEPFDGDDPLAIEVKEYSELTQPERGQYGLGDISGAVIVGGDDRGAVGQRFGTVPQGFVIVDIDGTPIGGKDDYEQYVSTLQPGQAINLKFLRIPPGTPLDTERRFGEDDLQTGIISIVIPQR